MLVDECSLPSAHGRVLCSLNLVSAGQGLADAIHSRDPDAAADPVSPRTRAGRPIHPLPDEHQDAESRAVK